MIRNSQETTNTVPRRITGMSNPYYCS